MDRIATDKKICQLLSQMNPQGMEIMFDAYYRRLVVWANTFLDNLEEAEDLVQDFFVFLWESRNFQHILPSALSSFLYISIRNRCLHVIKKQGKISFSTELEHLNIAYETYNAQYDEIFVQVEQLIKELPPQSRRIMTAVFIQNLKYREVSELFNVSLSTVKTLVRNSIKTLQTKLKDNHILPILCVFWNRE